MACVMTWQSLAGPNHDRNEGVRRLNWFEIENVREKLARLDDAIETGLGTASCAKSQFDRLGRDVKVVQPKDLPDKLGLSKPEGQARLLHDLASIELQAMELAVRTLYEFPEAPADFRAQLSEIAHGEGRHFKLCLDAIEHTGFMWGHWAVHNSLWNAVGPEDSFLDRIVIVHRYLEGSGLDAGELILRRLGGVTDLGARSVMKTIATEEVDHVLFGSYWFHEICRKERLDSEFEFKSRLARVFELIPRREKIQREIRLKAGFTAGEIEALIELQAEKITVMPRLHSSATIVTTASGAAASSGPATDQK
jgi:uncharacterized ferritin-like protein (DUF455 family)